MGAWNSFFELKKEKPAEDFSRAGYEKFCWINYSSAL